MNWGYKILMVYILFVAGIMVMVFMSSSQNTDLVTTDYYEKELVYQQKIDQISRTNALSAKVGISVHEQAIHIQLPPEMNGLEVNADVQLYCPSDKTKDRKADFITRNGAITFPISVNNKGLYEVKINWTANKVTYYSENKIFIQ